MKATEKKPVITLKNIKHCAWASEETHAYEATIYVNGKRFATVDNDGRGGGDRVSAFGGNRLIADLEARIAATHPKWGSKYSKDGIDNMEMSLEIICGNLVNDFLDMREFKKTMRRVSYYNIGESGIYQMAAKFKPTAELIARVKEKASWAKGAIFLHDLPESEAFAYFKNN